MENTTQLKKDNRELEERNQKFLFKNYLIDGLSRIAPFLSITRIPNIDTLNVLRLTTNLIESKKYTMNGSTLLYINLISELESNDSKNIDNYYLYGFRGVLGSILDPFVCIIKNNDRQSVFAYADDEQFLMEQIDGDHLTVITEIEIRAGKMGMRSLKRYCNLMIKMIGKEEKE